MSYVDPNYKTKKDFITAVKAGRQHTTYNPLGSVPHNSERFRYNRGATLSPTAQVVCFREGCERCCGECEVMGGTLPVCPFCDRIFQGLKDHIKTKHLERYQEWLDSGCAPYWQWFNGKLK